MVDALLLRPLTDTRAGALDSAPAPRVEIRDVRLPNGVRLRYLHQGPESGPAVVMLHGYGDSSFSFSRLLPLLPDDLRVVVPDQRGHGDSDRPADGYTPDDFATDAIALMQALDVPRAIVVGHSMGTFVARRIAAFAADRVAGLLLVSAAPDARNAALLELQRAANALWDPVDPAWVREFQESTVYTAVPPEFMDRVVAESLKVPARVWIAAIDGLVAFERSGPLVGPKAVLIGGDRDTVFARAEQEDMARQIAGASIEIADETGHAIHWEHPERCADVVEQLSTELGVRAARTASS